MFFRFAEITYAKAIPRGKLRNEIAVLEKEYFAARSEFRDVIRERDVLQAQLSEAQQKQKALQALSQRRQEQFQKTTWQVIQHKDVQFTESLKALCAATSEFVRKQAEETTAMLSSTLAVNTEYFDAEENYTAQLRRYLRQSLGAVSQATGVETDSTLPADERTLLAFARGVDANTHAQNCREMSRLQNACVVCEGAGGFWLCIVLLLCLCSPQIHMLNFLVALQVSIE